MRIYTGIVANGKEIVADGESLLGKQPLKDLGIRFTVSKDVPENEIWAIGGGGRVQRFIFTQEPPKIVVT